ncbi:hypothetical protein JCM11251_003114 [Rhodosporidiobolus azoricus]
MARRPRLDRVHGYTGATNSSSSTSDRSVGIRSIAFGTFPAPNTFIAEWERAGRGVDRMLLETAAARKNGRTTLVIRMWEDSNPFTREPESLSSIRISVEANTLDHCQSSSGGTSLFFHLSRPPLFEVLPPREAGMLKPLPRQVEAFDDAHARVVGYASRVLRVKLRSRLEMEAFSRHAEGVGLPRMIASKIDSDGSTRYGATTLALLQSWLLTLDVRIAYQLEKLVRNNLVDAVKVLDLRDKIEALISSADISRAEHVLSTFADWLGRYEAAESGAKVAVSREEENEPVRPDKRRKRRRGSLSSVLSSDSSEEDEGELQVIESSSTIGRPSSSIGPSILSIDGLLVIFEKAVQEVKTRQLFLSETDAVNLMRQVTITPTRILLAGPLVADLYSITRAYGSAECFISVAVRAEDGSRLRDRDEQLICERFKPFFRDGLELAGRSFTFLAFSNSALKGATCFFMTPFQREADGKLVTPERIHGQIGDFSGTETALIPAKYSARIAQAFSASKPSLAFTASQIYHIDDEISASGSCFTDGVGLISPTLMDEVLEKLKLNTRLSCFQFRLGGAKGMLQVDPTQDGRVVVLRPSPIKFASEMTTLEVAGVFGCGQGYLNRPLIKLLEDLGVKAERFLDLQNKATKQIRKSRSTLRGAIKLAKDWDIAAATGFISTLAWLARHDLMAAPTFANPFVVSCLNSIVVHALREIKHSARIPLPVGCFNLVGVFDISGSLEEGEIYARVERDGETIYIEGTVAISRSPTKHPGDLRLVKAVGSKVEKRIQGLTNCVVFSSKGKRSLPSMLAGGDLDGDVYLLLTGNSGLLPSQDRIVEPAAYEPSPTVKLDRPATTQDVAEFFFDYITKDRTGLVATRQLHLADFYPDGLFHPDCLALAQLHSDCVDAAKSGSFVHSSQIPPVPKRDRNWPDFLTNDAPDSYRSSKALGLLFRAITEDFFEQYKPPALSASLLHDVDPFRRLTDRLASLSLPGLLGSRLRRPHSALLSHYEYLISSFSAELSKLADLSPSARLVSGRASVVKEEELFLGVSLGARKMDKADKDAVARRKERAGRLFEIARRRIRDGKDGKDGTTTRQKVDNAWAAWVAAVEVGEERGREQAGRGGERRSIGLRSWAWLALGVLTEQLEVLAKAQEEPIVIDD